MEPRPGGRFPPGGGRRARRGPVAGRGGARGRAEVRRQQEPLLGRAEQLHWLRRAQQPACALPQQRAAAAGGELADRPACPARDGAALLGLAVDAPAAAGRSRLDHREEAAAVSRRSEPRQGPAACCRPPARRAREHRLPDQRHRGPGAGAVRPRRPRQARHQGGSDQAEGVLRCGSLRRDGSREQRPRSRRRRGLVLRVPGAAGTAFARVQLGRDRGEAPGEARRSRTAARRGSAARVRQARPRPGDHRRARRGRPAPTTAATTSRGASTRRASSTSVRTRTGASRRWR